jgi:hypothetical protein
MLIRIRDPDIVYAGSGMKKFGTGIRDKHPGSATLAATSLSDPVRTGRIDLAPSDPDLDPVCKESDKLHNNYFLSTDCGAMNYSGSVFSLR